MGTEVCVDCSRSGVAEAEIQNLHVAMWLYMQ